MAWGSSTGTVAAQNAKASSASYTAGAITAPLGDQVFLYLVFDNVTNASLPTITSITVPGGETAAWVQLANSPSSSSTGGAGVRSELWAIQPTQNWTAFTPVVTFSAAITAKASHGFCKSGGSLNQRTTPPVIGTSLGANGTNSIATTFPKNGDFVIGGIGRQTATAETTTDTDTTNGSWTAAITSGTTGGTDNTNVTLTVQTKTVTADGTQTFDTVNAAVAGTRLIVALTPAGSTQYQVSRVHAEALVKPTSQVAQVTRVHAESLIKYIGIDSYDQKCQDLNAISTYLLHEASGATTTTPPYKDELADVTPAGTWTYGVTPKVGLSGTAIQAANSATAVWAPSWPAQSVKTLTFWFKKVTGGSASLPIIGNTGSLSTNRAWIAVTNSGADIVLQVIGPTTTTLTGSGTSSGILDGNWHHIGIKMDGTNLTFYVDGANLGTVASASTLSAQFTRLLGAWSSQQTPAAIQRISFFRDAISDSDMLALATSVVTKPAVGRVSETDTARALTPIFEPPIGRVSETDTALALTSTQKQPINRITETDTARTLLPTFIPPINRASETDTARALTAKQTQDIGRASETDTARSVTPLFMPAIGRATETDTARALSTTYIPAIGRATETDTAITIGALSPSGVPILRAEETDTARALLPVFIPPIGRATDTETARALAPIFMPPLGRASETDTARALAKIYKPAIGRASETDTARALTAFTKPVLGRATETDTARAVTVLAVTHAQLTWYDGTENLADMTWYDGAVEDDVTLGWWDGTAEDTVSP